MEEAAAGVGMRGHAVRVLLRLHSDAGEEGAFSAGLDDTGQLPGDVEGVVGLAVAACQGELADGHPEPSGEVERGEVLDVPTRAPERGVDVLAGSSIGAPILAGSPAHGDLEVHMGETSSRAVGERWTYGVRVGWDVEGRSGDRAGT
jgi:hypothetical protein